MIFNQKVFFRSESRGSDKPLRNQKLCLNPQIVDIEFRIILNTALANQLFPPLFLIFKNVIWSPFW